MIKILVTGSFEGSVQILYGETGVGAEAWPPLLCVDFREATLNEGSKMKMLRLVPLRYGPVKLENGEVIHWEQQWGTDKLKFLPADVELDFETDFWWPFGNPINKLRCEKAWNKLSKADRSECVVGVRGYLWHLSQNQWKAKMNPATWFRDRCWKTNWYNVA